MRTNEYYGGSEFHQDFQGECESSNYFTNTDNELDVKIEDNGNEVPMFDFGAEIFDSLDSNTNNYPYYNNNNNNSQEIVIDEFISYGNDPAAIYQNQYNPNLLQWVEVVYLTPIQGSLGMIVFTLLAQ